MTGSIRNRGTLSCLVFVGLGWLGASAQHELKLPIQPVRYVVSLAKASEHLVSVKIELPPGPAERNVQLPVWYALYQVRDFSQFVRSLRSSTSSLVIRMVNKSQWRITGAQDGAEIEYDIFADISGPFGSQINSHHAFFNLAEILMYPVDARRSAVEIHFVDIPDGWRVGTTLPISASGFTADSYDELVDAPVEISAFEERDFDQDGGHYRVIVDAVRGDYDMGKILPMLQRIVNSEVSWMEDRPFQTYLFIYHFPREGGGGGMEHAYSTAIDVNAHTLTFDPNALASVTAHEFFHLWNVKRIRPQSLEPPDYTKENYTDALWFSEGVTSTVEDYTLLRAGFLDEHEYLSHLASAITELENRPAHLTQSAEESSLGAWLEKYSYYRAPERSISYYNKGDLLGVLLDLEMRDVSHGTKSLRDLFQWMNSNYAQKNKLFADSQAVLQAAGTITHSDLDTLFGKYVAGSDEIPWNMFFKTVGLQLMSEKVEAADPGFEAVRNFDSPLTVVSVAENGAAERAGLARGDVIIKLNGHDLADSGASGNFEHSMATLRPGETIHIRVRNQNGKRELSWKLDKRKALEFRFENMENLTQQQRVSRTAWLKGESEQSQP